MDTLVIKSLKFYDQKTLIVTAWLNSILTVYVVGTGGLFILSLCHICTLFITWRSILFFDSDLIRRGIVGVVVELHVDHDRNEVISYFSTPVSIKSDLSFFRSVITIIPIIPVNSLIENVSCIFQKTLSVILRQHIYFSCNYLLIFCVDWSFVNICKTCKGSLLCFCTE